MRYFSKIVGACFLSLSTLAAIPLQSQAQSADGQIERYQRKYISFFYPQNFPLNSKLLNAFQSDFPRFDYHLASTALNLDFAEFLRQTQAYQNQRAGDLAANRELTDPRFGDKVVSWSETQKIAQAAYVFVPQWEFEEIELDGPYPQDRDRPSGDWFLDAKNQVRLNMSIWGLQGRPRQYDSVQNAWTVRRKKVIRVSGSAVERAAARAGSSEDPIDISKRLTSSEKSKILRELFRDSRVNRALNQVIAQNPYRFMMSAAEKSLGYGSVIGSVRRMPAFLIRAEVEDADMAADRVQIGVGAGENAESLGLKLDGSYKITEYAETESGADTREIGWVKIRELKDDTVIAQPIIVGRDFELGDQVLEYPKSGVGFNLRGGAQLNPDVSAVGGGGAVDLDFNIGPAMGLSELYLTFSGGYYGGLQPSPVVPQSLSGALLEVGLQKKWFLRQLIFALGVRGGGLLSENNAGGGVSGLLGVHWQATPDMAFGLDGGWRQYSNFSGPLLEGFVRFEL